MAMRETAGSLRAYLCFAGVVSLLLGLRDLGEIHRLDLSILPPLQLAAIYVPIGTRVLLGVLFFLTGLGFKVERVAVTNWTKQMLVASGVLLFVNGALVSTAFGLDFGQSGFGVAMVYLLITIYLYRSVVRLAAEAAAKAPPEAKVV